MVATMLRGVVSQETHSRWYFSGFNKAARK
jgi:hypothetical protein